MSTIRTYGQRPYLAALLHGGPGAAGDMRPVARELAAHCGVLEFLQTETSVEGQIKELRSQLDACEDLPIILIGHSWGAWLGFLFAGRYPGLVRKLILVGAPAFEDRYNRDLMSIRLGRLDKQERKETEELIRVIRSGKPCEKAWERFGQLMARADAYECLPTGGEKAAFNPEIFQGVWAEASGMRTDHRLTEQSEKIIMPVVALHGADDPHPVEGVEKPLASLLPDFRMMVLPRCGHTPWREKFAKDRFFQILRDELTAISLPPATGTTRR